MVDEDTTFAVRQTLDIFRKVLGQKVNELRRKLIFLPNISVNRKTLSHQTINVEESENLGSYLNTD